jgi:hypothetical protein
VCEWAIRAVHCRAKARIRRGHTSIASMMQTADWCGTENHYDHCNHNAHELKMQFENHFNNHCKV